MPSLADVHGRSHDRGSTVAGPRGGDRRPSAGHAAQVSRELSAVGVVMFLLGIGFAFFFDSVLGTVGYLTALGLGAYGLVRWLVATVPARDLPVFLDRDRRSADRRRGSVVGHLRDRFPAPSVPGFVTADGSGRAGRRLGSRGRRGGPARRRRGPRARLRRLATTLRRSRGGGDRL